MVLTKIGYDSTGLWFAASELAGLGGQVVYDFSPETGKCNVCVYDFLGKDAAKIESLIEAYYNKYGTPIATGDTFINIPGESHDAVEEFAIAKEEYEEGGFTVTLGDVYQWLVDLDDGNVADIIILTYEFKKRIEGFGLFEESEVVISYSLRTAEEMQAVVEEAEKMQNARDADI